MTSPNGHARRVPAGLIDAGLASAATFLIGLYAIRAFDNVTMGFYALFMAAFGLSTVISTNVAYIPGEKSILELDATRRSLTVARSVPSGLPAAVAGGAVMLIPAAVSLTRGADPAVIVGLTVTAALTAIISPVQDHLRRLLHLGERSWAAAVTSSVQAVGAAISIAVLSALDVTPAWIAFGALGLANVASSAYAMWSAARPLGESPLSDSEDRHIVDSLKMRNLATSGRWLASTGVISTGNNLLVSTIIVALAGEVALGFAEAARTIAQPVLVVAMGLRAVLGPDSMRASQLRDRDAAQAVFRTFWLFLTVTVVAYGAVAGVDWTFSPLGALAGKAYVLPGLVLITIMANAFNGGAYPWRLELIGADREPALFRSELWSNGVQLVVGAGLAAIGGSWIGAAARPLSMTALGVVRIGLYKRPLDEHYVGGRIVQEVG